MSSVSEEGGCSHLSTDTLMWNMGQDKPAVWELLRVHFSFLPVFLHTPQSKFCQLALLSEEAEQPELHFFKSILL